MRRIALALLLGVGVLALSACSGWNWNDPLHPYPCPKYQECEPCCAPANMS